MKLLTKSVITGTLLVATSSSALADISTNIGVMSDYFYRGVIQNTSATTNGGIDYENGNFSAGTWVADVEEGLEVDVYGSFGFELDSGLSLSAGFTGYYYTGDFDDTYEEINLGVSYGIVSIEYSFGSYGNFAGPDKDYDFTAVTLEKNDFYGKFAMFGNEFDGNYVELGYSTEIGEFDAGISIIINDDDLDLETGTGTESIIFSISKSFDL